MIPKPKPYVHYVAGVAKNAATFWRHVPEALADIFNETRFTLVCIKDLCVAILGLALSIVAPLFVIISPITGLIIYRRKVKRYRDVLQAFDRSDGDA